MQSQPQCMVCLEVPEQSDTVKLKCSHIFCKKCIITFIQTLRRYNQLRPQKLCCLVEGCQQEIQDQVITKLFPGELGFVFNIIKKRYRDLKDPNMIIFDCKGYVTANRKPLVQRAQGISKQDHSKKLNELSARIIRGQQQIQGAKTCKNIFAHNKSIPRKQKNIICMTCGCSYCVNCFNLGHEGGCLFQDPNKQENKSMANKLDQKTDDFQKFVQSNHILRCLNPKCQVAIAKQEGCFWVKCRCSWQMCYPCKKLWGDCQHFSKYPYSKFIPPPQWMVRALNLY